MKVKMIYGRNPESSSDSFLFPAQSDPDASTHAEHCTLQSTVASKAHLGEGKRNIGSQIGGIPPASGPSGPHISDTKTNPNHRHCPNVIQLTLRTDCSARGLMLYAI